MNANQAQPIEDHRESHLSRLLDTLPFMFAAVAIVIVILAVMSPAIGNVYSNIILSL
jgi:hypothetical protein